MKSKINKIFTGLCGAAMLLSTSCVGDLDLDPNNPNLINGGDLTAEDYASVLAKCYGGMAYSGQTGPNGDCDISGLDGGTSQYTRALFMMNEFTTDEAIWIHPDNGVIDLITNTWGKDNGNIFGTYSRLYSHIAVCNDFIRMAKENSDRSIREMVLQARALRAMSYYWVIDIFGQGSFVLDTDPLFSSPEQKDRAFLYNWLDNELTEIENQYNEEFPEKADHVNVKYGQIGLDGVQALHARLCLNAQVYTNGAVNGYEKCSELCSAIIARHQDGPLGNGLAPEYMYLFCADNDKYMPGGGDVNEILWGIAYDATYTRAYGGTQFLIAAATANADASSSPDDGTCSSADYGINNPWKCMHATKQFAESFANDDTNDARWAMWLKEPNGYSMANASFGKFSSGYAVIKFTNLFSGSDKQWSDAAGTPFGPNWSAANGGRYGSSAARAETWVDTDLPLIRLADVYLMYAESYIVGGAGNSSDALTYVNYVRNRAGVTPWTDANLRSDNILAERQRELYWELTRRSDLVRHGKFSGTAYMWSFKGSQTEPSGTSFPSYMDLMPIPTNIIGAQPTFNQNPGY